MSPFSDDAFKLSRWSAAETLVTLDDNGDARPGLATGWRRTADTAWKFTLTRATKAVPKRRIPDGVALTAAVAGEQLPVTTGTPDPLLPQRLSSPQLSIPAESAYAADGKVNPVGTGSGSFRLVSIGGTTSATLDRYDGYWGEKAKAVGIDVSFVPDGTARAAAIRSGETHIAEAVPVSQAALLDPSR